MQFVTAPILITFLRPTHVPFVIKLVTQKRIVRRHQLGRILKELKFDLIKYFKIKLQKKYCNTNTGLYLNFQNVGILYTFTKKFKNLKTTVDLKNKAQS